MKKRKRFTAYSSAGFSLVEVILAASVFVLFVTGVVGAILYGEESASVSGKRNRAVFLAEEGIEAVRNIRGESFSLLNSGTWGLATTSNKWSLSGASSTIEIFNRKIIISSPDTNRWVVTSTVTWNQNLQREGTISLVTKFTKWMASVSDWTIPEQKASIDLSGAENGTKVQVSGVYAYLVRNTGSPNFFIINVTNPLSPSVAASLTLSGNPTNIYIANNHAYVSNESSSQELQTIDVSTPTAPSHVGTYDAAGSQAGRGIFIVGTTAYLVRSSGASDEFLIVNVVSPTLPTLVGSLDLGATGFEVFVSGSHAYIASGHNDQELQVIDISIPAAPALVASDNISSPADAITINGFTNTVFLSTSGSFLAYDVSTPTSPSVLDSVNVGANDISLNGNNTLAFVVTGSNTSEFQVIDIATLTSIFVTGTVNTVGNDDLLGVAYDQNQDKAYGVGEIDDEEFIVFAGG